LCSCFSFSTLLGIAASCFQNLEHSNSYNTSNWPREKRGKIRYNWGCKIFSKSNQICPNINHFCLNLPKTNQICPPKNLLGDGVASPAPTALNKDHHFVTPHIHYC